MATVQGSPNDVFLCSGGPSKLFKNQAGSLTDFWTTFGFLLVPCGTRFGFILGPCGTPGLHLATPGDPNVSTKASCLVKGFIFGHAWQPKGGSRGLQGSILVNFGNILKGKRDQERGL